MKIRETRDSPISGFLHDVSKTPALVQGSKYPPIQRFANDHVIACVAKELTLPPSQNFQKHHFPQKIYHKNKEQRYGKHHIHNRVMERRSAMLHSRYWVAMSMEPRLTRQRPCSFTSGFVAARKKPSRFREHCERAPRR
jgi:hypothetical protein